MIFALGLLVGCTAPTAERSLPVPIEVSVPPVPEWPQPGAPLIVLPLRAPRNLPRVTVFLSAGHYNGGKRGNIGVHGQVEAHVNRDAVLDLAARLAKEDRFDIVVSRRGDEKPSYRSRIAHAKRVGADVFIELHTVSRGPLVAWADTPTDSPVYEVVGESGFSILFNEGSALGEERGQLAAAVATSMANAGFPPYPGCHYGGYYDADPTPGVFIDRRGLMMLRRPEMPSIIIETHNAKDFEESLRWREPETHEAFAAAISDAISRLSTP